MKKYVAGCAECDWNGEFDSIEERRQATRAHWVESRHGVIGYGEVSDDVLAMVNEEQS